jgi:anti-sigma factor RsiW
MTHLTEEQFERLYDGSLEAEEMEAMLRHLDDCEACLDRLDQWSEGHDVSLVADDAGAMSETFQRKLMRRINREEASRAVLRLCFDHALRVFVFLATPFFAAINPKKPPTTRP